MARELKIWNGRGYCARKYDDPLWGATPDNASSSLYAAAYSRADLRRLIKEYCGNDPGDNELKTYFTEGAWGRNMEGVTPERGLWLKVGYGSEPPVRLI